MTGGKGQLDKLCAYDRAYYFVAVAITFVPPKLGDAP